jgi:predicted permease
MRIEDNIVSGMTPKEARRDALLRFGNPVTTRERVTAMDAALSLDGIWSDIRYGLRQLRKSPGFTSAAVLTLALGIGANTGIFSLVSGFLVGPLPYPHADRLVMVWERLRALGIDRFPTQIGNYVDYKNDNQVFEDIAAVENVHCVLATGEFPERVFALRVTSNLFTMMGFRPAMGRILVTADNQPGYEHIAVLSNTLWRGRFGSDPAILGKNIVLDGQNYEVVGVLEKNVKFTVGYPQTPDLWVPLPMVADPARHVGQLQLVARLREGITLGQAQVDMDTVAQRLERDYHIQVGPHGEDPGYGIRVVPLHEELVGNLRQPLLLMLGASGLIFMIACANVANLMLAQGMSREREIALRVSLGAGRTQLIRPLLVQAAILAFLGETLGIAVASLVSHLLVRLSPYGMARLFEPSMGSYTILFASCTAIVSVLLCGLLPAIRVLQRGRIVRPIGNNHQIMGEKHGNYVRKVLVVIETALSVALVIGAGLLLHSFLLLRQVPVGFNPKGLLTAQVSLPAAYSTDVRKREFYEEVLARAGRLADVDGAAVTTMLPMSDRPDHIPFSIEGRPWQPYGADQIPQFLNSQAVSTDYFHAMQIPVRQGRLFNNDDREESQPVAIVNETLVRGFWQNENPIGKHIVQGGMPRPGSPWLTIVGIVGDVRSGGVNAQPIPEIYMPLAQRPNAHAALVLRIGKNNPEKAVSELRTTMGQLDPAIPLHNAATYDEILAGQLSPRRYEMLLLLSSGGLALLLAAVGLYGVVSYAFAQRAQEIGLRLALGATANDVVAMVLRQGLTLTGAGMLAGLILAFALKRAIASALFRVQFVDFPVYAGVMVTLLVVALTAAYWPARRAASIDPMQTLRPE